jgi:hypothetical protein
MRTDAAVVIAVLTRAGCGSAAPSGTSPATIGTSSAPATAASTPTEYVVGRTVRRSTGSWGDKLAAMQRDPTRPLGTWSERVAELSRQRVPHGHHTGRLVLGQADASVLELEGTSPCPAATTSGRSPD